MVTALVAALHFCGDFELARYMLHEQGYLPPCRVEVGSIALASTGGPVFY